MAEASRILRESSVQNVNLIFLIAAQNQCVLWSIEVKSQTSNLSLVLAPLPNKRM